MGEQRRIDDYWLAYWGERFKSENEGYKAKVAALEAKLAARDTVIRELVAALGNEVEWLNRPFGMHTYNKGGIHDNDCRACAQRKRLESALANARAAITSNQAEAAT